MKVLQIEVYRTFNERTLKNFLSGQDNGLIMISKWFTIEQADLKSCTISTSAKRLNIKEKLLFVHHSLKCDFEKEAMIFSLWNFVFHNILVYWKVDSSKFFFHFTI